jgi:uncharacterized protein
LQSYNLPNLPNLPIFRYEWAGGTGLCCALGLVRATKVSDRIWKDDHDQYFLPETVSSTMDHPFFEFIKTVNYDGLRKALSENPSLANQGIPLGDNPTLAHPLHRLCDGVYHGVYSDEQAVEMARIFLAHGAHVDGDPFRDQKDTPIVAASSLHADAVALLYIERGANIHHSGCHGGTALHWAAWCGRDKVVKRLLEVNAEINRRCVDFKSTPLFWGVHGYVSCGRKNSRNYLECIRLLVQAGADKSIPNAEGHLPLELLDAKSDVEMVNMLLMSQ